MLSLKLGLSLNNLKSSSGGWTPNTEGSVVAWYH